MTFAADTSILVSAFIANQKDHFSARLFYEQLMRGQYKIVIPHTVCVEVLCAIGRRMQQTKILKNEALQFWNSWMISPNVLCKPVDERFMHDAAWFGWSHGLKGMDALVATTALYYDIPLVSSDNDFDCVKDVIEVLTLNDALKRVRSD